MQKAQPKSRKRKPNAKRRVWRKRFLRELRDTGNVREACQAARIDRRRVYRVREESEEFAAQWDEAMRDACDALEAEARRRAVEGVKEPVFYKGKMCASVQRYSDTLLIFLLKAHDPVHFRDNYSIEHSGPGGGPVQARVTLFIPEGAEDVDGTFRRKGNPGDRDQAAAGAADRVSSQRG